MPESLEQTDERRLSQFWHPVAYASGVAEAPLRVTLLGHQLVVTRLGEAGEVRVFADLCAHRGAAMSLGWVDDEGCLRCPYHGWAYDESGACVEIPSAVDQHIPGRARLRSYRVCEAGGLVWVCLDDDARFSVPPLPEWDDPGFRVVEVPTYDWACGVMRRTENFVDLTHLPWVHEGILGNRGRVHAPDHSIDRETDHLVMRSRFLEEDNLKSRTTPPHTPKPVASNHVWRVYPPGTVHWSQQFDDDRRFGMMVATSPIDAGHCRTFSLNFRDFDLDGDDDVYAEFQLVIAEQDRAIAESQRPEELPADLTAELHVRGADALSIEYRRFMNELATEHPDHSAPAGAVNSAESQETERLQDPAKESV